MGLAGLFSGENLDLWLCLMVPPLIVKRKRGIGTDFYISIELTILGWIPGTMMAIYILFAEVPSDEEEQIDRPSEELLKLRTGRGEEDEAQSSTEGKLRPPRMRRTEKSKTTGDSHRTSEEFHEHDKALAKRREQKRRKERRERRRENFEVESPGGLSGRDRRR